MGPVVTLMVAGRPITFQTRIEGCKPPYVPKAQPGVCPGAKRARKGASAIAKAVVGRKKAVSDSKVSEKAERDKIAKQLVLRMAAGEKFDVEPDQVPSLLEALDGAPPMNLAHMQIKGDSNKNLFQHHLRDIPRDQMPALPDTVAGMMPIIQELGRRGIKVTLDDDVDPRTLQATQSELSAPKVAKMAGFMKNGWKPGGAMIVSREGAIGDGHHRWAGAAMAATLHEQGVPGYKPVRVTVLRVDTPIDDLLKVMNEYSGPRKGIEEKP